MQCNSNSLLTECFFESSASVLQMMTSYLWSSTVKLAGVNQLSGYKLLMKFSSNANKIPDSWYQYQINAFPQHFLQKKKKKKSCNFFPEAEILEC